MGGCGCGGTVQYAPPACNPNFPTTCTALGQGNIVRVVGEDSASCKYTVPTLASNSLLAYNAGTALTSWADGSSDYPIFLGSNYGASYTAGTFVVGRTYQITSIGTTNFVACGATANTVGLIFKATGSGSGSGTAVQTSTNQTSSSTVGAIQGTTPTGQLVAFNPATSAETQFPVVAPGGATTAWGTIESIIPNNGVVYKASGTVSQAALGTDSQILTMVNGVPKFQNPSAPSAFLDSQDVNLVYNSAQTINVTFGSLVFNSFGTGPQVAKSGNGITKTLTINTTGVGGMDLTATTANNYYYVYAIYNSQTGTVNVIGSSSYDKPSTTNIGTYDYYRLIGMFYSGTINAISPGYTQNGNTVYFGNTNYVTVFTSSANTVLYWSGLITQFAPYQIASRANMLVSSLAQPANQVVLVQIANDTAHSSGANLNYFLLPTKEFYGSGLISINGFPANSSTYSNFDSFIPELGSAYYNINLNVVQGTAVGVATNLFITGYQLTIL